MNFLKSIFLSLSILLSIQIAANASMPFFEVNDPNRVDYPRITQKEMIVYQGDTITRVVANGLSAIIARPDQDVNKLLAAVNLNKAKFAAYNDFSPILMDDLITGAVYYLERKNKSADVPFHIAGPKETIWDISQMYAIRKDKLLKKNRMSPTEDVVPGRKLYLQKKRRKKDKVEIVDLPEDTPDTGPWERFIDDKEKSPVKTIGDKKNTLSDLMPGVSKDAKFHTVRESETIFSIAKVYNVTPLEIKKWNNLDNINLKKGDIIQVKPTSSVATNTNPNKANNTLLPNNNNSNKEAVLLPQLNNNPNTSNNLNNNNSLNNTSNNFNNSFNNNRPLNDSNNVSNFSNNNMNKQNAAVPANKIHIVERGEGVYSIARQYNLEPKELMRWNGLNNNSLLDVGEQIYLAPGMAPPAQHTVKKGETLYRISKKYDVEVSNLKAWNQLNGPDIQEGQSLFVSEPNFNNQNNVATTGWQQNANTANSNQNNQVFSSASNNIGNFNKVASNAQNNLNSNATTTNNTSNTNLQANTQGYHMVKPNENIYEIAARYKVQVSDLRKWNNLEVGKNIEVGSHLIVDPSLANTNSNNAFNQPATDNNSNNTINNSILAPAVENNNSATNSNNNNFLQPATDNDSNNNINPATGNAVYHTVKPNENLFSISKMYGVQVSQIKRLSQKTNNQVSVGDRLRIR